MPQPKIDSAVIKLELKKDLPDIDREKFFKIVKAAFSKRRKTIINALSTYGFDIDKEIIKNALVESGIRPDERAENISIEDFIKLSTNLPLLNI